jgi:hypothetical protein
MAADDPRRQPGPRDAMLEQLRYLTVEADALRELLAMVPPAVLTGRPLGEPSVLQQLVGLARRDRDVRIPRLARILAQEDAAPREEPLPDTDDAEPPAGQLGQILDEVIAARTELIARFEALSDEQWQIGAPAGDETVTAAGFAFAIAHEDVDVLRGLTARLHEARLSDRA